MQWLGADNEVWIQGGKSWEIPQTPRTELKAYKSQLDLFIGFTSSVILSLLSLR